MIIYLAGGITAGNAHVDDMESLMLRLKSEGLKINILESFYIIKERGKQKSISDFLQLVDNFILDSGAFSFFSCKQKVDFDEYITQYINFINEHDIKLFFELDIDRIIGYDRVKEIRRRLEKETGKCPIPVWHRHLGKEEFLRMCDEYNYVAIGGIVSSEFAPTEHRYFPAFIREAHRRGIKIHGLGFTYLKKLKWCHFDSVDSTSWLNANRYGRIFWFDGRNLSCKDARQHGRCKTLQVAIHNFTQWIKFSNYAETRL